MKQSRRQFLATVATAAAAPAFKASTPDAHVSGFAHIALPMENTEAVLAFYRTLGFEVVEAKNAAFVYVGEQMISFPQPALWQRPSFTLRGAAAKPGCGDLCFVWSGAPESLNELFEQAGVKIVEGPVPREGGRRKPGSSVYTRDPDGNLLEFLIYRGK